MKRILITGANKGIGLATVKKLLESYSDTYVLLGSRDLSRGQHTLNELVNSNQQWNDRIDLIKIDVEQDDSVNSAAEEVAEKFGKNAGTLYGIVNNAGIGNSTSGMNKILQVNTYGIKRVCEVFIPLLDTTAGRIVNVTSASGPMFLAGCSEKVKRLLTNPEVNWAEIETFMNESLKASSESGETVGQSSGLGTAYGLSKACTNAYTIYLARQIPNLIINACTPGFIETDLTRPMAEAGGKTPAEMGMKSPEEGASASIFLLMGTPEGSGHYYGSDCLRSPMDRYRSPGDPPYTGD
ncbi:MAG: 2-(R)-hydroxypropyl-CoM dehydrogenase [Deltaproteobacteria bacterium]|jgi:NAD(P)-dependent dehydrogenase (short-subunit alcohol dehydrogenase family)|nr:2-(R)-hydroxypropyl-CoM dehydrogenase [Deltaproteobacteria bacterium]